MSEKRTDGYAVGRYKGLVAESYRLPAFLSEFDRIAEIIRGPDSEIISSGRNLNVKAVINGKELVVKSFGRQWILKDLADSVVGGKARRSWEAASVLSRNNAGTPFPVAYLERWEGLRLEESYYISEFQPYMTSFGDELVGLYREDPDCGKLMDLLETVAGAVAKMHRAGIQHNDLGNQNILLHRADKSLWEKPVFIDLNRATICGDLSARRRARDISRLNLPSELLRVFKDMYYSGAIPPDSFHRWERFYRKRYAFHCATRKIRHPFRCLRDRKQETRDKGDIYPVSKDIWIWDERSGQPINTLGSKDRNALYPRGQFGRILSASLGGLLKVKSEYGKLKAECWKEPVSLKGRIGVAVEPDREHLELELALLGKLGAGLPVLIRFYHHKGREQWDFAAEVVDRLHGQGRKITVALVQDRQSSKDAGLWGDFVRHVVDATSGKVEHYELGHAVNRVKWGIWDIREYLRMADAAVEAAADYPEVKFTGPAVIDFEYPFLMAVLKGIGRRVKFEALSHHLYVDRRGAPENRQGPFAALEKFILARAIGRCAGCCGDRLIVSEVNWPLKGTGVYSPVGAPYVSPQPRETDPNVSEDDYADYMLRYILLAVCSGMVERVYWWRLVARGYGLVDDTNPDMWRERAGFAMLEHFVRMLGSARFTGRGTDLESKHPGLCLYDFETASGTCVSVMYTTLDRMDFEIPFDYDSVTDAFGVKIKLGDGKLELTGRPVYVYE